jgi:hypothetical protein
MRKPATERPGRKIVEADERRKSVWHARSLSRLRNLIGCQRWGDGGLITPLARATRGLRRPSLDARSQEPIRPPRQLVQEEKTTRRQTASQACRLNASPRSVSFGKPPLHPRFRA